MNRLLLMAPQCLSDWMLPSQSPLQVGGWGGTSLGSTEHAFLPPTRHELPNSWPEESRAPRRPMKSSLLSPLKLPQSPHMLPRILAGTLSSRKLTPSHRSRAPKTNNRGQKQETRKLGPSASRGRGRVIS